MRLLGGFRHFADWTVGHITAVAARLSYAAVGGFMFAFSRPSAALVVAAEIVAFAVAAGGRMPLRVAVGTLLATGTLRTWQLLFKSFKDTGLRAQHITPLSSIWDWEPPETDASGAWHILRQLVDTSNRLRQENPAISHLLAQPQLAASELGMRLYYYYLADDEPVLDAAQEAALDHDAADKGSGQQAAKEEGGESWVAPVPAKLKQQLSYYRDITCLAYDYATDDTLGEQLSQRGYTLLFASYAADLASGCPAYFLCISEQRQEVALVIRGTFSPEDAFVDLLANGMAFDDDVGSDAGSSLDEPAPEPSSAEEEEEKEEAAEEEEEQQQQGRHVLQGYCHSGMGRAAFFLGAKFGSLLRLLCQQGCQVTLVGHSLGAGVASLLAVYLRNRGLGPDRLHCWAFETPACMDVALAEACADVVTSLVNCDDCVPRLCIRSFAGLLEELAEFDWQTEAARHGERAEKEGTDMASQLSKLLLLYFGNGGGSGGSGSNGDGDSVTNAGSGGEGGEGKDGDDAAAMGAAADEALHAAADAAGDAALTRLGSGGFERAYNAHVPGRVVLVYRHGQGNDGGSADDGTDGLAIVPCTHRAVRRLRVSSRMLTDHFVDHPEIMAALGGQAVVQTS